jgi:4-hydroxybenzoate polyprenyltransferase
MKALIISLRPRQWIKNFFVFVPLIYSKYLFDVDRFVKCLEAFIIFCLISGAVYLINDIGDRDQDKIHPEKCKRPIARGDLKVGTAAKSSAVLVAAGLTAAFSMDFRIGIIVLGYFVLNLSYSFYLKQIVILDVMAIAAGFLLRVLGGAFAISVQPTDWLLICGALLALFLGFGKRRNELVRLEDGGNSHRKVLQHYSPYYLDQMIAVVTASTVMSYILYTISYETVQRFGSTKLLLTSPFVCYGIFRYLYLIHKKGQGGDPANSFMSDVSLIVNVVLWAFSAAILIYFV